MDPDLGYPEAAPGDLDLSYRLSWSRGVTGPEILRRPMLRPYATDRSETQMCYSHPHGRGGEERVCDT
ncbi:MAG: hypothetical protein EON58_18275 [Alphaproteobacteria bacterium]|nr:MAG: hypothetical protein EON58_18275 [Alphaproteobacteria bacterium]